MFYSIIFYKTRLKCCFILYLNVDFFPYRHIRQGLAIEKCWDYKDVLLGYVLVEVHKNTLIQVY